MTYLLPKNDHYMQVVKYSGEKLKQNNQGITTIIICHRISSAKNADYIMVLDHGKMTQFGTHKELVSQEGYYADMYTKQQLAKTMIDS